VSIIHSSSLAYKPVGFNQPQPARNNGGEAVQPAAGDTVDVKLQTPPSTTQQIKHALSNAGWLSKDAQNQGSNFNSQKALNAYTENLNLSAKQQIAETISGIDTYA
jgi:hypothetical protein